MIEFSDGQISAFALSQNPEYREAFASVQMAEREVHFLERLLTELAAIDSGDDWEVDRVREAIVAAKRHFADALKLAKARLAPVERDALRISEQMLYQRQTAGGSIGCPTATSIHIAAINLAPLGLVVEMESTVGELTETERQTASWNATLSKDIDCSELNASITALKAKIAAITAFRDFRESQPSTARRHRPAASIA